MATPGRLCFPALLALAFAGCDDAGESASPAPPSVPVRIVDSAGVRIVEYAATPQAPTLTLAAEPLYMHGAREGDYLFQRIPAGGFAGVLHADGSAVISDEGNEEVVRIGADGRHHEIVAGPGEGPGEIKRFRLAVRYRTGHPAGL